MNIREDPAWKALHKFVGARRKIAPERLQIYGERGLEGISKPSL